MSAGIMSRRKVAGEVWKAIKVQVAKAWASLQDDVGLLAVLGVMIIMIGIGAWNALIAGFGLGVVFASTVVLSAQRKRR